MLLSSNHTTSIYWLHRSQAETDNEIAFMTIPVQRSGGDNYHTPLVGLLYSAGYGRISRSFIVTIDHMTRDRLIYASPL